MFKGLGSLTSMMRQAQQMSGKMQEVTERLKDEVATGTAGGGMVEVEVNGLGEVLSLKIDPAMNDREMIESLVPAAINQAQDKAKNLHREAMQSMTSDLDVPGLNDAISKMMGQNDLPRQDDDEE